MIRRKPGDVQPGIPWGPFTLRIPFYHFRLEWPETLQGLIVAGATGLALIPILTHYLGVDVEVALAVVIIQSALIASAPLIFGDPYCHGWVTPSIPLVLAAIGAMTVQGEDTLYVRQAVTAFTLMNAAIFLFAGITGLGRVFVSKVPIALKAGIIFGAAVSAFAHEFRVVNFDEVEAKAPAIMAEIEASAPPGETPQQKAEALMARLRPTSYLRISTISALTAVAICLVLMFSSPLERLKKHYRWLAVLAGLGLAPGFVAAMLVSYFTGEAQFSIPGGWSGLTALNLPPWERMWHELSPFSIGFPTAEMYWRMLPLSVVVYIIAFGDIITANEILHVASQVRPDEKIDLNPTRTHLNLSIRNGVQALLTGPFPVTHGPLWTGVHVVVAERYKQGRLAMDSIFGGIAAYYFWGVPILLFWKPLTSLLEPMLPVALSMTILLTGFACSYIAMAIPRTNSERGVALAIGMVLAFFGAEWALILGVAMTITMSGWTTDGEDQPDSTPPQDAATKASQLDAAAPA
jgi:hypothetical protein